MPIASVRPSSHLLLCPQSFPASGTFPKSCLSASDNENTGAAGSASVLPVNIQSWSPLRLTGLISLLSKGLSGVFSSTTVWGINSSAFCLLYSPALTTVCDHWEDHSLTIWTFVGRVMSLPFNTLSRFVIAFLLWVLEQPKPVRWWIFCVFKHKKKRWGGGTSPKNFPGNMVIRF